MPLTRTQRIDQAVFDVFITMLGLTCTPAEAGALPDDCVLASVAFTGCVRGRCVIALGRQTAELLTGVMLGIEPHTMAEDEHGALLADTVGELCNMIAGGWKSRLDDSYSACALGPPQLLAARLPRPSDPQTRLYRFYSLSGECIEVEFTFDQQEAA